MSEKETKVAIILLLSFILLYLLINNKESFETNEEEKPIEILKAADCLIFTDDVTRQKCFSEFSGPMV